MKSPPSTSSRKTKVAVQQYLPHVIWRSCGSRDGIPIHISSFSVLFIGDVLHPVHHLAIFSFLNGNVRHGCTRRRSVPVLLIGRNPDDISGMDFLDRTALALCPPAASGDNESLS